VFKLHFKDATIWRNMIASVEKILDEGVFAATPDGISLRALDTSHVVMIDIFYPREAFIEYEVEGERVDVGVSFSVLSKILRRAGKNDELVLGVEGNNLLVEFRGRGSRLFKVPLINLVYEKLPEPRIAFTVKAKMLGSIFRDTINVVKLVADSITFKAFEDKRLLIQGEGDIASTEIELSLEAQTLLEMEVESPDSAKYSVEYFTYMTSASRVADIITIQYAEEAPIKVDLEYTGGGRLTFYVSPRAE